MSCTKRAGASVPNLTLNVAELSSQLIESELVGCERGAFTGATWRTLLVVPSCGVTPAARRRAPSREELLAVYEATEGRVRATSKHFGKDRRQIYRWLEGYGIAQRHKQDQD